MARFDHQWSADKQRGGADLIAVGDRWVEMGRHPWLFWFLTYDILLEQKLLLMMVETCSRRYILPQKTFPERLEVFGNSFSIPFPQLPPPPESVGFSFQSAAVAAAAAAAPVDPQFRFSFLPCPGLKEIAESLPVELQRAIVAEMKKQRQVETDVFAHFS